MEDFRGTQFIRVLQETYQSFLFSPVFFLRRGPLYFRFPLGRLTHFANQDLFFVPVNLHPNASCIIPIQHAQTAWNRLVCSVRRTLGIKCSKHSE